MEKERFDIDGCRMGLMWRLGILWVVRDAGLLNLGRREPLTLDVP
jgi:hypothetical protein